jgi:hypothetical protein
MTAHILDVAVGDLALIAISVLDQQVAALSSLRVFPVDRFLLPPSGIAGSPLEASAPRRTSGQLRGVSNLRRWSLLAALAGPALEGGDCRVPFSQGDVDLNRQSVETALALGTRLAPGRSHIECRLTRSLSHRLLTHQYNSCSSSIQL